MKKIVILILLFVLISLIAINQVFGSSGWIIYHESAFKGKVIDTETKEPIEGAVVVAIYRIREYSFVESNTEVADVKEVLTDKNGEFYIPPHTFYSVYPVAKGEAPDFIIYKPGYSLFGYLSLHYFEYFPNSPLRVDMYTRAELFRKGITIDLLRLKTKEERRMAKPGPVGEKSDWKKQKQLIKLIREEWEFLTGKPAGDLYKN